LKILELLVDGERCVCEIFPAIGGEQSNVSKHLGFLRSQGIVIADRRGMRVLLSAGRQKDRQAVGGCGDLREGNDAVPVERVA